MVKKCLHTHTAVARLPGVSYRLSCRNCRENETTWQLKAKRTAAASRGFLAAAQLFCSVYVSTFL